MAKLGLVRDEASETVYWLEYAKNLDLGKADGRDALLGEARELSAIFSAAYRTAKLGEE